MFYTYGTCVVVGSRHTKQAVPSPPPPRTSGRERLVYGREGQQEIRQEGMPPTRASSRPLPSRGR
jgi:hypothetical protein